MSRNHFRYVLYAYDNLNLQELFLDEVTKNLTLGNGSVLFQYNRKLCYNKITKFISAVGFNPAKMSHEEVSPDNNGDQMPCKYCCLSHLPLWIILRSHISYHMASALELGPNIVRFPRKLMSVIVLRNVQYIFHILCRTLL